MADAARLGRHGVRAATHCFSSAISSSMERWLLDRMTARSGGEWYVLPFAGAADCGAAVRDCEEGWAADKDVA